MFKDRYKTFLQELYTEAKLINLNITSLPIDHIGYVMSSTAEYDKMKVELARRDEFISEHEVGGIRVGMIRFAKPKVFQNKQFFIYEIIEPKQELVKGYWDHIELILNTDFDSFMAQYSGLNWDTKAVDRDIFPMLTLHLPSGKRTVLIHSKS